jgi:hypothetical protein
VKVVINACFGGFSLSEAAYERLIELGVPVKKYIEEQRDPETHLFLKEPANDGEVIFDRDLSVSDDKLARGMRSLCGRYWDCWTRDNRTHPLVIRVVEELGEKANGRCAKLKVVEIPEGVDWQIDEYDGNETVREKSREWS